MEDEAAGRSESELAELRDELEALRRRVAELERRDGGAFAAAPPPAPRPRPHVPVAESHPQTPEPSADATPVRAGGRPAHAAGARSTSAPAPRRSNRLLPWFPNDQLPVVLMGGAGGVALLLGLLYFVWYSVHQGWISAEVRLALTAVLGVAGLGLGSWLGGRRQVVVAAGVAGAGLGAWFGAILVARHVHELLSPVMTFTLLAAGAVAGLFVATHRGLRFLASLAALGAVLTPLVVGSEAGGVHELMSYQLLVGLFLFALVAKRRWFELEHLAWVSWWVVLGSWSAANGRGEPHDGVLAWSLAYVAIGLVVAALLFRRSASPALSVAVRVFGSGVLGWGFALSAAGDDSTQAVVVAALAATHGLATLVFVRLVGPAPGSLWNEGRLSIATLGRVLLLAGLATLAWIQLFAVPVEVWDDARKLGWWTVMAYGAAATYVATGRRTALGATLLPVVAGFAWSMQHGPPWPDGGAWSAGLGLALAALHPIVALVPSRAALERGTPVGEAFRALAILLGGGLWALLSYEHTRHLEPHEGWFLAACGSAVVALVARVAWAPSLGRTLVTTVLLGWMTLFALVFAENVEGVELLRPNVAAWHLRVWFVGSLGVVGLCGLVLVRRARALVADGEVRHGLSVGLGGLAVAAAIGSVAMHVVTGLVAGLGTEAANARSLNQAGWSASWAMVGLALLVVGLRDRGVLWRRSGIMLLFLVAAKLVVIDLHEVTMMWRVLSFGALGVCLLVGSYLYRRALVARE